MLAASRSTFALLRSLTICVVVGGTSVMACSSNEPAAAAKCDDAKCAKGNKCLPLGGEIKCRKTCSSNADPSSSCPFDYTCVDTQQENVPPFCVADTAVATDGRPLVKKPSGQWGSKCQANLGLTNPACDTDQAFYCYGTAPTDGDAYCTRYGCETDRDCAAGFWCAEMNTAPNVENAKHSAIGEVQKVCLQRTYCATCVVDLDCPPIAGKPQHCVGDMGGNPFCSPECDNSQGCPNEAKCIDPGDLGKKICFPRAGACVGDGSLCSPCRNDKDCGDDGACVKGQYTTERTCAKKSTTSCGTKEKPTRGSCPETADTSGVKVACYGQIFFQEAPAGYCHGIYVIGAGDRAAPDIGCWTPNRK
jgi:hypothetical protein